MWRVRTWLWRAAVGASMLSLLGLGAPARAQELAARARPPLVLEAYTGARPADAGAILAPLFDELEARGFAARPRTILPWLPGRMPRPGVLDPHVTATQIALAADAGYDAYLRGDPAAAEATLGDALARAHDNPAVLALDAGNLATSHKLLIGLALSQARNGDAGAALATMGELIRTFWGQPSIAPARADYGPEAEALYRAAWRQLEPAPRGELAIEIDRASALIFVDGQLRGAGRVRVTDLLPGTYHVVVAEPAGTSRRYTLDVNAGQRTALHVDWALDSALWVSQAWIGLAFASDAERVQQARLAGALVRRWSDGELIVIVSVARHHGQPQVTATLYDLAGNVVRSAVADAGAGPLRALARFVDKGSGDDGWSDDDDGDDDGLHEVYEATRAAPSARVHGARLASELLVGAGAAALVTGGVLYAIDQDPGINTPYLYRNTAPAGVAVGSLGIAAAGVGLWLWAAGCGSRTAPLLAIRSSGGFIGWAGEL